MNYKEKYRQWLTFADPDTKAELESLTDEKEIEDRFYKDLAFGRRPAGHYGCRV